MAAPARKPGVVVLTYHRIGVPEDPFPHQDVSVFRSQMQWLRANCTIIAPEELRERVRESERLRPPVLVTFDDGFRGFHDHAFPILRELDIPAVVFLATHFADEGGLMWSDLLYLAVHRTRKDRARLPWAEASLDVRDTKGRTAFLRACKAHLKEIPEREKEAVLSVILDELGADAVPQVERQMLSWTEVRATMSLARYGGHTHTHTILSRADPARLEHEIKTCRDRIAAETAVTPTLFAYPNGQPCDFTAETKAMLRRYGFEMAFTAADGVNGKDTDWMEVRRVGGDGSVPDLVWRLPRLWNRAPAAR